MMKFLPAFCLILGACAAGHPTRMATRMPLTDTSELFPAPRNPQLRSADRMSKVIRSEIGDVASADVRMCITADGRVQALDLVRGSSLSAFDAAVLHDVAEWQFSGMPGSSASQLRSCKVTTISYRPHE